MLKKSAALLSAMALAAAPVVTSTAAIAQPAEMEMERGRDGVGNPFGAPGAGIGIALFAGVLVFIGLLAGGVIFDDDDNGVSP